MTRTIRTAASADAQALAELTAAAIRATYAPFAQESAYESVIAQTCRPDVFREQISAAQQKADNWLLVAVENSWIAGFLDFVTEDSGAELRRLYTAAGATGRGIGAELLADLETRLAPGLEYDAVVHVENHRALAFWARHGFVTVGTVDVRDHFTAHRGVNFDASVTAPEPCVVLRHVVGQH